MNLNLGSGYSDWDALHIVSGGDRTGWKNIEVATHYKADEHYDFSDGIREADGSVELIWMGDVLEHIYKWKTRNVLADCFRVLKPGGQIWISVPDLGRAMTRWLANDGNDPESADLIWGQQDARDGKNCGPDSHHNGFTQNSLGKLLASVGFVDVHRTDFHKTWFELGMKGTKP